MDFSEAKDLRQFRDEAATWVRAALAREPVRVISSQQDREHRARWWQNECMNSGWAGLSWPAEYGGRGLTAVHEAIFNAESLSAGAPLPINFLAQIMVGPAILTMGTNAQKAECLPKILTAEEIWCIGFSEPDAGSDLASLRTRAAHVNGHWRVNGQKVWTSWAHIAHRCLLLARTDPAAEAHRGLTMLLADMTLAEVRPLRMINDEYDFNEVYLDDFVVPTENVLGEIGGGWQVALAVLGFERRAIPFILYVEAERKLRALVTQIRSAGLADDRTVQPAVGRIWAEVQSLRVSTQRSLAEIGAGREPGELQLTLKLHWSQVMQEMNRFALSLAMAGKIDAADSWATSYLRSRANSIESGTDEILLSIIAERALKLPRSR